MLDEGREHVRRAAIRHGAEDARRRYDFFAEPRSWEGAGASQTVTARLAGNFPGAPADLRYRFELAEGRIARLEIGAA